MGYLLLKGSNRRIETRQDFQAKNVVENIRLLLHSYMQQGRQGSDFCMNCFKLFSLPYFHLLLLSHLLLICYFSVINILISDFSIIYKQG